DEAYRLTGPPSLAADPIGYERATTLWMAHANRPDVSAVVLANAASFFEATDTRLAEALLLRAQRIDPNGPWSARLGQFYARVLVGSHVAASKNRLRTVSVAEPRSPYGVLVRKTLGESTDERLLTAAGWVLARAERSWIDFDPESWAEACFARAMQ